MNGAITNILNYVTDPVQESGTIKGWVLGLLVILILAFLWSRVVKQLLEI